MPKEKTYEKIGMIIFILVVMTAIFTGIYYIAKKSEEIALFNPKPGIECAVVSRYFHTSIDCYEVDD